jgi:hypothetical protein
MFKKLKYLLLDDTVYIAVLLIFVAGASFALGRLSQSEISAGDGIVKITDKHKPATPTVTLSASTTQTATSSNLPESRLSNSNKAPILTLSTQQPLPQPEGLFVASKAGTKYHAPHCSGAKTIKEANKIYFASEAEAEASGYTRAANCPRR